MSSSWQRPSKRTLYVCSNGEYPNSIPSTNDWYARIQLPSLLSPGIIELYDSKTRNKSSLRHNIYNSRGPMMFFSFTTWIYPLPISKFLGHTPWGISSAIKATWLKEPAWHEESTRWAKTALFTVKWTRLSIMVWYCLLWYDIVYFEHKLSWLSFGLPKRHHTNERVFFDYKVMITTLHDGMILSTLSISSKSLVPMEIVFLNYKPIIIPWIRGCGTFIQHLPQTKYASL